MNSYSKRTTTKPEVFVAGGNGPYANTVEALKNIDLAFAKGKRVLLKPNLGRAAEPETGIVTNCQVVAAAIDSFNKAGAIVAVGESPIVGVDMEDAFEVSGVAKIAKERRCRLLDLNEQKPVDMSVDDGIAVKSLKVCRDVVEYDFVVSMPVMKMHMHTGVTLSVKNMKGCLWRRTKVMLHMLPPVDGHDEMPINIAIADLAGVLRPDFSIIDGTVGMEGMGPSAGAPKDLDVVVASFEPFAADAVACRLMGTDAEKIPYLRIGAMRGYGVIDLDDISVFPENWQDMASNFLLPPENLSFEFPNINVLDKNSCSACQSTLLLFLKEQRDKIFEYFPSQTELNIAIGKGNPDVPDGTICIGNCTSEHEKRGVFIHGCPPVGSEILKAISKSNG